MSSFLLPKTIIDNYTNGFFACPYCRKKIVVEKQELSDPGPCPHCQKSVMIPHRLGPFWLFQRLGAGAMGAVYKAFHQDHQRSIYAVKTLSREGKGNERLIRALQREAQVTSLFSIHPNIINLVSHGWEGDEFYMVLEYIQGQTLLDKIEKNGKLSELETLRIVADVVSAERHICEGGYLFRDLKPENILIADENGHVYLFDFGLTLPMEVAQLDQGAFLEASPIYVPPERLTGEGEDVSSEIYSLGMVLYYAVTGQTFFTTAQEITGILKRHVSSFRLSGEVTKIGTLPDDLAVVLTKMKKRLPEDRYQDFSSLEVDIRRLIEARDPEGAKKSANRLKLRRKVDGGEAVSTAASGKPGLQIKGKAPAEEVAGPKPALKIKGVAQ